ncbi:MAG: hypothetical protein DRI86_01835 [Bacteroidetes bacterium]|nr:MAG: hypothetical protein DRI86_01835 [Bacteroidota bacterium]
MRKIYSILIFIFFAVNISFAQILTVGEVEQEQTEWCWAGVSKCIVDYYGDTTDQCEIAEYTRTTATWHNFGNLDCCNDPNQGCNYWNYNYGYSGSIKDILLFFSGITNYGTANTLTKAAIDDELFNTRPFVIRWGWYSGGGHFVVGYGKSGNTIYYMNPWYGEGKKLADYDWIVDDGVHEWTHTNVLTTSPTAISNRESINKKTLKIVPNPSNGQFSIQFDKAINSTTRISIYGLSGQIVYEKLTEALSNSIDLSLKLQSGMYFIKVSSKEGVLMEKFMVY